MSSALKYNNDALQFLKNNTADSLDDEINVMFNKAIFNVYLGDYDTATVYANDALKKATGSPRNQIVFLIAIIQMFRDDLEAAEVNLNHCMNIFLRERNIPLYMRTFQCQYYLYTKNYEKYKTHLDAADKTTPKEITSKATEETIPIIIEALQLMTDHAIKRHKFHVAQDHLQICEDFIHSVPNEKIHYKTFYLKSQLIRKTINEKSLIVDLLRKSLSFLEDDESPEKAIIMHELAFNLNETDGFYKKSSEIFYTVYKRDLHDLMMLKHIIPKPRY